MRELVEQGVSTFVEVGPGRTLTTFADQMSRTIERTWHPLATLPTAEEGGRDHDRVLGTLGRLWELGVDIDWNEFHRAERRRRVSLPTYPFSDQSLMDRQRPCGPGRHAGRTA